MSETTRKEVAKAASWIQRLGTIGKFVNIVQSLDRLGANDSAKFLREYRRNAMSCAGSALTQVKDKPKAKKKPAPEFTKMPFVGKKKTTKRRK